MTHIKIKGVLRTLLVVLFTLSLARTSSAQEIVTLTTPVTPPTTTTCHVERVTLDIDKLTIAVSVLCPPTGTNTVKTYDNSTVPTGSTLLHALNTANFSVNSLIKAVYNRLITDGVIVGTISGPPQ